MKKSMKNISILLAITALIVLGCSTPKQTKLEPKLTPAPTTTPKAESTNSLDSQMREIALNQTKVFNELEITVVGIKISPMGVGVSMKLVNQSKSTLSFFPNQKSIVIGKQQLDAKYIQDSNLSGDINAGVEKIGVVVFEDKSESLKPNEVNKIDLKLGSIFNQKNYKAVECDWTLEIPKL